jgi:predicted dehydrogenase
MATTSLRIGIVGRGSAALAHADRLLAIDGVTIVGCADADLSMARTLASEITGPSEPVPAFEDHSELLRQAAPEALVIVTPNHSHYRAAMDGLQAGCHLLIATPLSTNVQEAVDIVGLARARDRKVGVGHGFRRTASLIKAREMLEGGAIGRPSLITSTLAVAWPERLDESERDESSEPQISQGGILAELGLEWIDALLWTSRRSAEMVSAIQSRQEDGLDQVTVASIRLVDGILASIAISGVAHGPFFELVLHGEGGRLRATDDSLDLEAGDGETREIPLPEADPNLDSNFVAAVREGSPLCCPASEVLDAVRVLEAIARSAAIGQFVGLA